MVKTEGDCYQLFSVEEEFSMSDALKTHGLCHQAAYGDVKGDRPGWTEYRARKLWDAWDEYRGTSKTRAKI